MMNKYQRKVVALCFLVGAFSYFSCGTAKSLSEQKENNPVSKEMLNNNNPVIAHRGAWKGAGHPQNSLASFKAAIQMKCFGSETDVHMTDDGALVINHDPTYHGMDVQKSKLSDLRKVSLSNGEKLPEMKDFLQVIAQQDQTKLVIEIKPSERGEKWAMSTTQKVLDAVKKYKAAKHVLYISFDYNICKEIVRLQPEAEVQYLYGNKTPAQVKEDGLAGLDYHYSVYRKHPEYIKQAKHLEVQLDAWTVDDAENMDWLLENGFEYITTNEPELLFERAAKLSSEKTQ